MAATAPFTEDALNRFRITHSDRELRPLLRRIHRLPYLSHQAVGEPSGGTPIETEGQESVTESKGVEAEHEKEILRLEVQKWRVGVDRVLASVGNLERQRAAYLRKADETVARTEQLRQTLAEERALLVKRLAERDNQLRCDEVAKKILARGKTRKELDEQVAGLESSLAEHQASYALYLSIAQSRAETFAQITTLVDQCRALKLPVDPTSTAGVGTSDVSAEMDIDPTAPFTTAGSTSTSSLVSTSATAVNVARLSAQTLPFQPSAPGPGPGPGPSRPTSQPQSPALHPHPLPTRPGATSASATPLTPAPSRYGNSSLPSRPSALRGVTTGASTGGGSGLEEGEVGGSEKEDGEVSEASKRKAPERGSGGHGVAGRNTRSRLQ